MRRELFFQVLRRFWNDVWLVCLPVLITVFFIYFGSRVDFFSPNTFLFKALYLPLAIVLLLSIFACAVWLNSKAFWLSWLLCVLLLLPSLLPNISPANYAVDVDQDRFTLATFSAMTRSRNGADIKRFIEQSQPDILCLQEVLEQDLNDFTSLYPYMERHGGNLAILSRFPIIKGSRHGVIQQVKIAISDATSSEKGQYLLLLNMHMPRQYIGGKYPKAALMDMVEKTTSTEPTVMCGDFNMTPKNTLYTYITSQQGFKDAQHNQSWQYGFTFPNANRKLAILGPWIRIDYIFYRGLMSSDTAVVNVSNLSDHRAVMTELAFLGK